MLLCHHQFPPPPAARWHASALCLWAGHRGTPKGPGGTRARPKESHQLLWRLYALGSDYSTHRPPVRSSTPSCRRDRRRTSLSVDHPSHPRGASSSFSSRHLLLCPLSLLTSFNFAFETQVGSRELGAFFSGVLKCHKTIHYHPFLV